MIIGLSGAMGSGKDTVADYLVKTYGFEKRSFAELLKKSVAALFDIPLEFVDEMKWDKESFSTGGKTGSLVVVWKDGQFLTSFSWREILQRYGTESHRNVFGINFWVDQCLPVKNYEHDIVISDTRFENEIRRVYACGGLNINVKRLGYGSSTHVSEHDVSAFADYILTNDGTLHELYTNIETLIDSIKRNPTGATLKLSQRLTPPLSPSGDSDAGAATTEPQE